MKRRKDILARALVDPAFRKLLFESPEKVLGSNLTDDDRKGIEQIKAMIPPLSDVVASLASNVLCNTGGGGCGAGVVVAA